jgi:hypothetical protein
MKRSVPLLAPLRNKRTKEQLFHHIKLNEPSCDEILKLIEKNLIEEAPKSKNNFQHEDIMSTLFDDAIFSDESSWPIMKIEANKMNRCGRSFEGASFDDEPNINNNRKHAALDKWLIDRYVIPPILSEEEENRKILEEELAESYHRKNYSNKVLFFLSPDVCSHICQFLDFEDVCRSVARVCRDWSNYCYLGITTIRLSLNPNLPERIWDALFYDVIIRKCKQLKNLYIKVNERVELMRNAHLRNLAKSPLGPNLKVLALCRCSFLTSNNGFYKISKYMHGLTELNLSESAFLGDENLYQMSRSLYNLRVLQIQGCKNLTDNALLYISTPEEVLKGEGEKSDKLMTDESIFTYKEEHHNYFFHNLTSLDISYCNFSEKAIENVGKYMTQLQHLNIRCISKMTDHGVMYLRSLINLRSLCMGTDFMTLSGIDHAHHNANRIAAIIGLDGEAVTSIDSVLESMLTQLTNLDTSVPSDRYITDYSMVNVCTVLTKIESLSLKYCMALSQTSLIMISSNLCGLHKLDLEGCRRAISDQSLASLFTQCCFLDSLNLSIMGKKFGTALYDARLRISSTKGVQRSEIQDYVPIAHNLKQLDMSSSMLTDYSVKQILHILQGIITLDLSNNQITDISLQWISQSLPNIQYINITNCHISTNGVRKLLLSCKSLIQVIVNPKIVLYLPEERKSVYVFPEWRVEEVLPLGTLNNWSGLLKKVIPCK